MSVALPSLPACPSDATVPGSVDSAAATVEAAAWPMVPGDRVPGTGDRVEGFMLGRLLGRGAHGAVYLAHRGDSDQPYALKIIPLPGRPRSFVERILRECALTSRLRHPGIVTVHQAGYSGDCLFIVMEVARGQAGDRFADGILGWETAAEVARQVALALEHAQLTARMIHRDIKPANLVIDLQGGVLKSVQVVDFGLSRSTDDKGEAALTMTGTILGTPFYMSPEQATGSRDLDFRTDLYALGATLFHLIAGRPPFPTGTPVEILLQHCHQAPPRLDRIQPRCPKALADVVARCLAKRPDERFGSYPAFIAAVTAAVGEDPFTGNGVPHAVPATAGVAGHPVPPAPVPAATALGSEALGALLRAKVEDTSRRFQRQLAAPADDGPPPTEGPRIQNPGQAIRVVTSTSSMPAPDPAVPRTKIGPDTMAILRAQGRSIRLG